MREDVVGVSFFVAAVGFAIGIWTGVLIDSSIWQRRAIQHKAAHYDQITGEFKWNDEVVK